MSWRDRLRLTGRGKFRDAEFFVDAADGEFGRRTIVHEMPGRNQPYVQDDGLGSRRFTFDAFVLGDNYDVARDKLRAALEAPGPGELVHPYWGTLTVSLDGPVRVRETTADGGMARFTIRVIEGGNALPVAALPDTAARVTVNADKLVAAAAESFATEWSVLDTAAFVAEAAIAAANDAAAAVRNVRGAIDAVANTVSAVGDGLEALASDVAALILAPIELANTIIGLHDSLLGALATIEGAVSGVLDFLAFDSDPSPFHQPSRSAPDILSAVLRELVESADVVESVPETTPQRRRQVANQRQMRILLRTSIAAAGCRVAANLAYTSSAQASAVRAQLFTLLDELSGEVADGVYGPCADLKAAITEHLTTTAVTLPRVVEYTPAATLPALVIAHHLYGDARRAAELVVRNRILNPAAVVGGLPLQVLSDA